MIPYILLKKMLEAQDPNQEQGGGRTYPHAMYDPQGNEYTANNEQEHTQMEAMGYTHDAPDPNFRQQGPFDAEQDVPEFRAQTPSTSKLEVAKDIDYYSRLFEGPLDIAQTPANRVPATVVAMVQEHGIDQPGDFEYMGRQATDGEDGDIGRSRRQAMEDLDMEGAYADLNPDEQTMVRRAARQIRLVPGFNTGAAVGIIQRQENNAATGLNYIRRNPNDTQFIANQALGGKYGDEDYQLLDYIIQSARARGNNIIQQNDELIDLIQGLSASGYYPYLDAFMSLAEATALNNVETSYEEASAAESPTYAQIQAFQRSGMLPADQQTEMQTRFQAYATRFLRQTAEEEEE